MKSLQPYLCIVLCLLSIQMYAGKKPVIYVLDTSFRLSPQPSYVAVQVSDHRSGGDTLGTVGLDGKIHPLLTHNNFGHQIEQYCTQLLGSQGEGDTLMLALYDFRIDMVPKEAGIGTFHFHGQFFLGRQDRYRLVADIDSVCEVAASDAGERLLRLANERLVDFLLFAGMERVMDGEQKVYTKAEASSLYENQKKAFPVYRTDAFKEGVYLTMTDFLNNTPADTGYKERDHYQDNINHPDFYYKNKKGWAGAPVTDAFAIYNGKTWYVPGKSGWKRMYFERGEFFTRQTRDGMVAKDYSRAIASAGIWFGLAGIAVATAIAEAGKEAEPGRCIYEVRFDPLSGKCYAVRRL